jgi:peptidoglycan/xylan/chitin deacetylase (PgdA/CDA1 family)
MLFSQIDSAKKDGKQKLSLPLYINHIARVRNESVSFFSQLYHFLAYSIKKPKMQLEKGMFVISVDVDVGSRELGVINKGKNDENVRRHISEYRVGEIDEVAFPLFFETFNNFEIPVTFAIRGQLVEVDNLILESLLESCVEHDIGAHGYFHREFTNLSHNEAENELNMISEGMKKFGIIPRSFVFPRGCVAHLGLLERYGYKCYRGVGDFLNDCMHIEKQGKLYNVHPSLYLNQSISSMFLKKILDLAIAKKLPFHIWFHLWNFGKTKGSIQRAVNNLFFPLLKYVKKKERSGLLNVETMLSATDKVKKSAEFLS